MPINPYLVVFGTLVAAAIAGAVALYNHRRTEERERKKLAFERGKETRRLAFEREVEDKRLAFEREKENRRLEFEREKEGIRTKEARQEAQKALAVLLLAKVEHFAAHITQRHRKSPGQHAPSWYDDPMEKVREEIAALAVGLTDPLARAEMDYLDTAMWWLRDPDHLFSSQTSTYGLTQRGRQLLGAIERGEPVPTEHPEAFASLLKVANDYNDYISDQAESQAAYERERVEEERAKREAARTPPIPPA